MHGCNQNKIDSIMQVRPRQVKTREVQAVYLHPLYILNIHKPYKIKSHFAIILHQNTKGLTVDSDVIIRKKQIL